MGMGKSHIITLCIDMTNTETVQLDEYNIFSDLDKDTTTPAGKKYIGVHLVYNVKHDRHHKDRFLDDEQLTEIKV